MELSEVYRLAEKQMLEGKGKERHGEDTPFREQVACRNARLFGIGGPLYQAMKKIEESTRLDGDAKLNELLGAMNYVAIAVMVLKEGKCQIQETANVKNAPSQVEMEFERCVPRYPREDSTQYLESDKLQEKLRTSQELSLPEALAKCSTLLCYLLDLTKDSFPSATLSAAGHHKTAKEMTELQTGGK